MIDHAGAAAHDEVVLVAELQFFTVMCQANACGQVWIDAFPAGEMEKCIERGAHAVRVVGADTTRGIDVQPGHVVDVAFEGPQVRIVVADAE